MSVHTIVASMDFRAVFLSLKLPKPDRSQIKWVASSNIFINKSTGQESFLLFLSFVYSCICVLFAYFKFDSFCFDWILKLYHFLLQVTQAKVCTSSGTLMLHCCLSGTLEMFMSWCLR